MVRTIPQHIPGRWEDCPHCLSQHKVNCHQCKAPTGLTMNDEANFEGIYLCQRCFPRMSEARQALTDKLEAERLLVLRQIATRRDELHRQLNQGRNY